jgi:hypothetical protein
MVLECEWKPELPVDGDFQRLVQARADVRVWVSCSPNQEMAHDHIANCKKQIKAYRGTLPGDRYVFVIHNWTKPYSTLIERFGVGSV